MIHDMPVYQEPYYADAPITRALSTRLAAVERSQATPIAIGVLGGILIGAGLFLLGYQVSYAAGVLKPWVDARGWIVLLFIAVGAPILMIYYRERGKPCASD